MENNLNFYKHQEEVSIAEKDIKIVDEEEEAIQKKKKFMVLNLFLILKMKSLKMI